MTGAMSHVKLPISGRLLCTSHNHAPVYSVTSFQATYIYITHAQNLNWANGLLFAHAKNKPTDYAMHLNFVLLCCTFNK